MLTITNIDKLLQVDFEPEYTITAVRTYDWRYVISVLYRKHSDTLYDVPYGVVLDRTFNVLMIAYMKWDVPKTVYQSPDNLYTFITICLHEYLTNR